MSGKNQILVIPQGLGGIGGYLDSVVGGPGINVDNTNPENPVISLTTVVVSSSITADNNAFYSVINDATFTDPAAGVEGVGYTVRVLAGIATINSDTYNIVGTIIHRYYQGGAWHSTSYNTSQTLDANALAYALIF